MGFNSGFKGLIYVIQIIGLLISLSKMPKTECSFHLHAEGLLHRYCQELPIILHEYNNYHKELSKTNHFTFDYKLREQVH
jgi:hypothetical protein